MAVVQMKKLSAIVPKADSKKLIRELQRLGCVEIKKAEADTPVPDRRDRISKPEKLLSETDSAISFLTEYSTDSGLSANPKEISLEDFESGLDIITEKEVYKTNSLSRDITSLKGKIFELQAKIKALDPWCEYELELPCHETEKTVSLAGAFPSNADLTSLARALGGLPYAVSIVSRDNDYTFALVTAHKSCGAEVKKAVSAIGFTPCTVSAEKSVGYAKGKREKLKEKLASLEDKLSELISAAKKQSERLVDFKALSDLCAVRIEREQALEKTGETSRTRIICGWVPKPAMKPVEEMLNAYGCAYEIEDPAEGDDVPTLLSNNLYSRQFEPIISMYSLPHYGEFDPTWIMSLFYTVIFGMMFADVGYGLIVLFGCIGMIRLMRPSEGLKRILTMFALSAVSCIFFGIMFGGYFGDLPQAILKGFMGYESVKSPALIFDMIENPIGMLVFSLAIGVLHIVCAMLIKMYILIRAGDIFGAVFDVGSWLVVFAGIGIIFVNTTVGIIVAAAGAAMLVLTQGRHEKNIIMKIVKGIMSLYDIISYASDLLSYSRILALSLSSAVIATVVNLLATMMGFSVGGVISFVLIFTLGHTINFALNLLSSYIHASRLQYLEFFGKFYEGGGREFAPLSIKSNKVKLK